MLNVWCGARKAQMSPQTKRRRASSSAPGSLVGALQPSEEAGKALALGVVGGNDEGLNDQPQMQDRACAILKRKREELGSKMKSWKNNMATLCNHGLAAHLLFETGHG